MANTPQAKKRIRRNQRRTDINRTRVSRIRTFVKQVEAAVARVQLELAREVAKGPFHKNRAARKFARLTRRIATIA